MSAETLPGGLRTREALAVRRDNLAVEIVALMLERGPSAPARSVDSAFRDYRALVAEIAALGEVVMGPGDWRRVQATSLPGRREGVR
jgi:hypothetical protein